MSTSYDGWMVNNNNKLLPSWECWISQSSTSAICLMEHFLTLNSSRVVRSIPYTKAPINWPDIYFNKYYIFLEKFTIKRPLRLIINNLFKNSVIVCQYCFRQKLSITDPGQGADRYGLGQAPNGNVDILSHDL